MYGLPPDFDPRWFVGRTLQCVRFYAYTVCLDFDSSTWLQVESSFAHWQGNRRPERETMPPKISRLMQLTEATVVAARGSPDGTLELDFSNDHHFACYDDMPAREAYQIHIGGRTIIV